jgi:hypothetical protein
MIDRVEVEEQRAPGVVAHHALDPEEGRHARPRVIGSTRCRLVEG